ncbi:hypothetical protein FQA39_LY13128 [Lamprigera yunnana]|nr:hypothetical protein FQA39_LY13128 [Lamprigera yunnana]
MLLRRYKIDIQNHSSAVRELAGTQELQDELLVMHGDSLLATAITRLVKDSQWAVLMNVKISLGGLESTS